MTTQLPDPDPAKQATVAVGGAGLVVGSFCGGMYVLWALLVISGAAQWLMNTISVLHVIRPVYVIEEIDPLRLAGLALLSAVLGYTMGGAFAVLWNRTVRSQV